jgi:hypothetical protein
MMLVIIVLTAIELFFIYFASSRLSRPVEDVSSQLQAIENLNFETHEAPPSHIKEIARLESAASLLRTSLKSFSSFVPLDVVRQLIKSGIPLTPGVEPRFLTVLFFPIWKIFPVMQKVSRQMTFWHRSRLISRKSPLRFRKKVEPSTSSLATASWPFGMPRFSERITFCVAAPARCGRRGAWSASTTPGRRKDGHESESGSVCVPKTLSGLVERRIG